MAEGPSGCGAPDQGAPQDAAALAGQTVVEGTVTQGGHPVGGAYVRLLDSGGEFTAEVVASAEGKFRFFARPGIWTVRALAPGASGEARVMAAAGRVTETQVNLSSVRPLSA
jgi:hypothetical protein